MSNDDGVLRAVLLVVGLLVLLPMLWMGSMILFGGFGGVGGHMAPAGGGWFGLFGIVPLLLFIVLVYLLYVGLRDGGPEQEDAALEELRTAYARGDLSDEEFEHRRERLREER